MKLLGILAGATLALVTLTGCGAGTALGTITHELTTQTPVQVTTLGEAQLAARGVTDLTDAVVQTGKLTRDQLTGINNLNERLHSILTGLETDQAAGKSLVFSAFQQVLTEWSGTYARIQGVH